MAGFIPAIHALFALDENVDARDEPGHGEKIAVRRAYFLAAILRQCSHAAWIRFSFASGVRNAECAESVTFGNLVSS
jgi:hypothetical protein